MNKSKANYKIEEYVMQACAENRFANLTITQICNDLNISRSIFYYHYKSIPDVLEKMNQRFVSFHEKEISKIGEYSLKQIKSMLKNMANNRIYFICYIKYVFFKCELFSGTSTDESLILAQYDNAAAAAIILVWLMTNCKDDVDVVAERIYRIYEIKLL